MSASKARAGNDYGQDSCSQKPREASCADTGMHLHIMYISKTHNCTRPSSLSTYRMSRSEGISTESTQNEHKTISLQLTNTVIDVTILFPLFKFV